MKRVAFCTLGCKVNQYDSEAMLEKFVEAGYLPCPFSDKADVYVINTCVVTGAGEKKSRQMIRRAQKQNPDADIVIAGCMAQRDAEELLKTGARLVLGSARRGEVTALLHRAREENKGLAAVGDVRGVPYEGLAISGHEGHTRANLKIQEGCDRFCAYCIIPYVRGGIRSREPGDIFTEAGRLSQAGFRELVLTGIHLTSYGRDLNGPTLIDAVRAAAAPERVSRVRLGSLEPVVVTEEFVRALQKEEKVCPQFHLALQSGSDGVLKRMRRRYTAEAFARAADILRAHFPGCALTTDIISGFPGETLEEHNESLRFCEKIAFSRMHVFPYSRRTGTLAASMPGQVSKSVKDARAAELISLGEKMAAEYARSLVGQTRDVLFETEENGAACGYTPEYLRVRARGARTGDILPVKLLSFDNDVFEGVI